MRSLVSAPTLRRSWLRRPLPFFAAVWGLIAVDVTAATFAPTESELDAAAQQSPQSVLDVRSLPHISENGKTYVLMGDMKLLSKESHGIESAFGGRPWTNGNVYYLFQDTVLPANRRNWRAAAAEWSAVANVRFSEIETGQGNYIHVQNSDENNSAVGMVGGKQIMNILDWNHKFKIAHEIGHALGLIHEQSRSDRDAYVTIFPENILPGYEGNFEIRMGTSYGLYDFESVMHYSRLAFSQNEQNTIEPVSDYWAYLNIMGQRDRLSQLDAKGMLRQYGEYTVIDLGDGNAFGINDAGQIVGGTYYPSHGYYHATLFSLDGIHIDLGALGDGNVVSLAYGINNAGQIAGYSGIPPNLGYAAVSFAVDGGPTNLGHAINPPQSGPSNMAFAINSSGAVVGMSEARPALFHIGSTSPFPLGPVLTLPPGALGPYGSGIAINDGDQIVGWYQANGWDPGHPSWASTPHPVLFDSGNWPIDLLEFVPEAEYYNTVGVAFGINNNEQIVGYSSLGHGATVFARGQLPVYLGLGDYSAAYSINDHGQIVGEFLTASPSEARHGFLYSSNEGAKDINNLVPPGSGFRNITIGSNICYCGSIRLEGSGKLINNWGQIIAQDGDSGHALVLKPFKPVCTVLNGTQDARVTYMADFLVPIFTNMAVGAFGTSISMLGGTAGSSGTQGPYGLNRRVIETFTPNPSPLVLASDTIEFQGTLDDVVVIQLTYNQAAATELFGAESSARLCWFDRTHWVNAVEGNSGGAAFFAGDRGYDPGMDLQLGKHGIDTSTNTVWAVINHGGYFGVWRDSLNTTPGSAVVIQSPSGNESVIFSLVTVGGFTTFAPIEAISAGPLPAGYQLSAESRAFDIATTATVAPPIDITFHFPSIINPAVFASLRILHGENGTLVDRTAQHDFATKMIRARVDSLSPFVVAQSTATPNRLLNISTRLRVETGDSALIGGLIITGNDPKRVIIRGIGPSLSGLGVPDALQNPTLQLYQGGMLITENDNWKDTQQAEIENTGIPPSNELESAIVRTLAPGAYTAILRGKDNGTGIGLVEAYDLSAGADAKLANISTRGFVATGDNVLIGGFIVGSTSGTPAAVVVRAIGPSLSELGVPGALQNPTLDIHNGSGTIVASNDNWRETQQVEIDASGIAPSDDRESAIVATLASGAYTAIVSGTNNTTGVAVVEVYNVQ